MTFVPLPIQVPAGTIHKQHQKRCQTINRLYSANQTRRFFGGRQPLCGIGVTSLMDFTSIPAVERARTADSRPLPGPLTRTSTERRPDSFALFAAVKEAC